MTRLIILSLLRERPMHGYEIQQFIQESRLDQWANVLSGSIYYALNKMEEEGLIRAEAEERTGARLRKIYGITPEGEKVYHELLRESLVTPPHSLKSDFLLAVNLIHTLPKEEVLSLLRRNMEQLEETKALWQQGYSIKKQYGLSEASRLLFENSLQMMDLDIQLLYRLLKLVEEDQAGTEKGSQYIKERKWEEP
mgnify:FL=1